MALDNEARAVGSNGKKWGDSRSKTRPSLLVFKIALAKFFNVWTKGYIIGFDWVSKEKKHLKKYKLTFIKYLSGLNVLSLNLT